MPYFILRYWRAKSLDDRLLRSLLLWLSSKLSPQEVKKGKDASSQSAPLYTHPHEIS